MNNKKEDNGLSFYSQWWMSRALLITCVVLLLSNLCSIATIFTLFPLKEIRPMLLTVQDKSNQVVKIEPIEKDTKGQALLMETLSRQFVIDRETIDCHSEPIRWERLSLLATDDLNTSFSEQMDMRNNHSPLKIFCERHINRSVKIISSASLAPSASDVWQVEWESNDKDEKNNMETRQRWVSTITANCEEKKVNVEHQFINPIGFTVHHYTVSSKQGEDL